MCIWVYDNHHHHHIFNNNSYFGSKTVLGIRLVDEAELEDESSREKWVYLFFSYFWIVGKYNKNNLWIRRKKNWMEREVVLVMEIMGGNS